MRYDDYAVIWRLGEVVMDPVTGIIAGQGEVTLYEGNADVQENLADWQRSAEGDDTSRYDAIVYLPRVPKEVQLGDTIDVTEHRGTVVRISRFNARLHVRWNADN